MDRRLRLFAIAIALGAFAAPTATLADNPPEVWQITGLVLGGTNIPAQGKLSLQGTSLGASVGCNSIGGQVALEAGTLSIVGDLTTTLIGCPADIGQAESALMKILSSGPITMGDSRWTSAAGEIDIVGAGGANGSGDIGVLSTTGTPVDGPTGPDALTVAGLIGIVVLLVATIGVYVYIGPRRTPGGSES